MLNEILAFLNQTKLGKHTIQNLTQTAVSVLDSISSSPDALLRAKDINLLQTVLFHQLEISGFYLVEQDSSKALNLSLDTLDITVVRETPTLTMLYVPAGSKTLRSQSWVSTRLTAQLKSIYSDLFVGIVYRNLSLFFPPKLFLRNRDENEIQYQIFSQVVTFVPISSNLSKNENVSIKVDFLHKFSTDFFNATSKERWEVRCGYADMRSFAYDWDIYTCTVKSIDEQSSTCICSKFGSYVLILVLAQTFRYLMVFQTLLEMFVLVGISSHLSKLLIVFTELTEVPRSVSSKYTVVGIISGVPLITVFGNHLTYKTMNLKLRSWWLMENSLALNIFLIVIVIVTMLFIFIYFSVTNKLGKLIVSRKKHEVAVKKRLDFSTYKNTMKSDKHPNCIFIIRRESQTVPQIVIGQKSKLLVWNYFDICCQQHSIHKQSETSMEYIPICRISTKQDADLDNQSGPNRHDIQLMSVKTIDTPKTSISKAQSLSNAFESCLHTSSNFCDLSVHESPAVYERDLESHSSYPSNKKQNSSNCMFQSPDILTTYVGLDLVACTTKPDLEEPDGVSRLHPAIKSEKKSGEHKTVRIMFPPQVIITPDDAISKILEAETIADQSQRTQPDGHAENQESDSEAIVKQEQETIASKPRQVTFREDNLDGVLDSISHDLDYLLNRNEDLTTELEVRKVSKLPGKNSFCMKTVPVLKE
ncbi:hypothetical protein D910_10402 [Dendroctonus ponderosae]|uniref:GPS domain-containing protein n=1 Tax=Dendroctonus ponderosae TaxID=77166 RepID=U4USM0_DENPD|nr:hypothetical protein D910_10402 [Dendroctonus ponderosae]